MAAPTIQEIEKLELEYNIELYRIAARRAEDDASLQHKRAQVLNAKSDYLVDCMDKGIEPELDLTIVQGSHANMWGGSSD
jgi:hypothetical protein